MVVSGDEWQTKFNVSPGPALWSLVLGPFGPDLDLDLSLTIITPGTFDYWHNFAKSQKPFSSLRIVLNRCESQNPKLRLLIRLSSQLSSVGP